MEAGSSLLALASRVRSFHPGAPAPDAADAVLIVGGRIAAVGRASTMVVPRGTATLDLPGTTITPGLTDAHLHVTEWALARREVALGAAASADAAARMVAERGRVGAAGWIRGRGWNPHRWGGVLPGAAALDAHFPEQPVALQSHDMHSLWVNGAALRQAGISETTPDPAGGRIVRDEGGRPTGVLQETAAQLVTKRIPPPTFSEMLDAVREAQSALHTHGITGFHSLPGIHAPVPDPLSVLEALRGRGELRLRVLQHLPVEFLEDAIRLGLRSGFGGDAIRIGGIKMFLDGALGSRTAWMRDPYEGTRDRGLSTFPAEEFRATVARAAAAGLASTVHAIGDAAVGLALDVLGAADTRVAALPHRIEHVQCFPDNRLDGLARSGVVCSVQPAHLITDWRAADRHWGPARARWTYAFRTLLDRGAILACGSDAPVEPVDPRLGLFAATVRTDLEGEPANGWFAKERITLEEAFRGYTVGPAFAARRIGVEGQLTPGALGDLVAWEGDPFAPDGPDPLSLRCAITVAGGAIVHA